MKKRFNLLFILTACLFVFIPLYPKLPLADIIPGYLVRIRLEDFAVLFVSLVWFVQFLRKKIAWNTFFFWLIIAYLMIGLASILSGLLLNHTIPAQLLHLGKSSLHLFRYGEYFALFVIGFSAITNPKQLNQLFRLLLITIIGITIYGAGQKYLSWPVYSTMNREYSKGQALTLGEHAKVQSTFGGHYDLAAYLVIVLPILFSYFLNTTKWRTKVIVGVVELGGWWMLVLSGSKTSLLATGLAHLVVLILYFKTIGFFKKLNWLQVFKIGMAGLLTSIGLFLAIFILNKDMATAFLNLATKIPGLSSVVTIFYQPAGDASKPQDWIVAEPIYEEKKIRLANGEEVIELVKKELEWSPNALKYGISMGIRLDTLWPNAITALRRNPYVGSSYGNLNKVALEEFTDSDSTDNNYLRTLGETGLLGFTTFYGLVFFIMLTMFKASQIKVNPTSVYAQALIGAIVGLAFNALYIDVFAASKVAFIFWLIAGVTLKSLYLSEPELAKRLDQQRFLKLKNLWQKYWPLALTLLVLGLLTWRNPYLDEFTLLNKFNFSGDDYQNLVLAKCLAKQNQFSLCRPEGSGAIGLPLTFSPAYAMVLSPIYSVLSHPNAYYFVNYLLFNLTFVLLFFSLSKVIKNRLIIFVFLTIAVLNPWLRETVLKSTSANLLIWALAMIIYLKLILIKPFKRLYTVFFNHPATTITLIVGGIFITLGVVTRHQDPWLNQMKIDSRSFAYATIKRANLIFDHQLKKPSYLITSLNPYYFDLYGNGHYQLLPYTPNQELFSQAPSVWGNFDFEFSSVKTTTDLAPLYAQVLETNPLYFTNYAVNDFVDLRRLFSFKTVDLDCSEECNLYQLSAKTEPPKLIEPTVYNNLSLGKIFRNLDGNPKQAINLMVVGHTYPDLSLPENQPLPGQVERYNELNFAQRLKTLPIAQTDFLVLLGNLATRFDHSRTTYFDQLFTDFLTKPLINVPRDFNPKDAQSLYQPFAIGDSYFVRLNTLERETLTKGEIIGFYNLYYDLEFSQVDYLFIFSYEDLRNNTDFMTKIVPLLGQLNKKSIYVISGDKGELNATSLEPKIVGNVTFIKTGFNETSPIEALNIKIDPIAGVTIK